MLGYMAKMPAKLKIDPIERVTNGFIPAGISLLEQQRLAGIMAREGIEWAKSVNKSVLGRVPPYVTTVDGVKDGALESVRLDGGQVITEFELIGELLSWVWLTLIARSPNKSGAYARGHKLFADNQEIDPSKEPPVADEYVFINVEPYARRLEVGKTNTGRDFLISVPNRIYERTAKDAKARFGNVANIKSTFRALTEGYRLKRNQSTRRFSPKGGFFTERKQRLDRVAGTQITVPAIYITLKGL